MGLGELLSHWSSAEKLQDKEVVFGLYAIWWARIGLAMQLLGGLAVVADLLGEDKIRARAAFMAQLTDRLVKFAESYWMPVAVLFGVGGLCAVTVFWFPSWLPLSAETSIVVKLAINRFGLIIALVVMALAFAYCIILSTEVLAEIISNSPVGPLVKVMAYGVPVVGTIFVILTS